jgi:Resolvase, N terminal domain
MPALQGRRPRHCGPSKSPAPCRLQANLRGEGLRWAMGSAATSQGLGTAPCRGCAGRLEARSAFQVFKKDLLHIMERVREAGAGFRSITEAVDTTTSAGRMVIQMLGSFAEFERSMVRERTRAGLAAARDRGVKVGRPAKLSRHQQEEVIRAVRDGSKTAADAARLFGLHRSNITRLLARANE